MADKVLDPVQTQYPSPAYTLHGVPSASGGGVANVHMMLGDIGVCGSPRSQPSSSSDKRPLACASAIWDGPAVQH